MQNTTLWQRAAASHGLFRPNNDTFGYQTMEMHLIGHFQTNIKTLKIREVIRISSCFAISVVGTAQIVGFVNLPWMLPQDFAADVPGKLQSEIGRNQGIQGFQNAVKAAAAAFAEIHLVVDSVPGSCNMCWEELPTLFENQGHEPTWENSRSAVMTSYDCCP